MYCIWKYTQAINKDISLSLQSHTGGGLNTVEIQILRSYHTYVWLQAFPFFPPMTYRISPELRRPLKQTNKKSLFEPPCSVYTLLAWVAEVLLILPHSPLVEKKNPSTISGDLQLKFPPWVHTTCPSAGFRPIATTECSHMVQESETTSYWVA